MSFDSSLKHFRNSWFVIDFGLWIIPNAYTLRHARGYGRWEVCFVVMSRIVNFAIFLSIICSVNMSVIAFSETLFFLIIQHYSFKRNYIS